MSKCQYVKQRKCCEIYNLVENSKNPPYMGGKAKCVSTVNIFIIDILLRYYNYTALLLYHLIVKSVSSRITPPSTCLYRNLYPPCFMTSFTSSSAVEKPV